MGDPAADYAPPITFMVVQKRHHTRFFPSSPQAGDRSGNVPPGARMTSALTPSFLGLFAKHEDRTASLHMIGRECGMLVHLRASNGPGGQGWARLVV